MNQESNSFYMLRGELLVPASWLVEILAKRLQLQERMTTQMLKPGGDSGGLS
ncbi:hypothetical protein M1N59_00485 [Dehalococcoidales bacterium]|nr:hypothetical protein [Dehalococcoidales bacterium]